MAMATSGGADLENIENLVVLRRFGEALVLISAELRALRVSLRTPKSP